MKNRRNILKIVSVIALLSIVVPSKKFDIPYGLLLFLEPLERINEHDVSTDLIVQILGILGLFLIFLKNKMASILGYILAIIPLLTILLNIRPPHFSLLFWISLIIFMICSFIVFKQNLRTSYK